MYGAAQYSSESERVANTSYNPVGQGSLSGLLSGSPVLAVEPQAGVYLV